MNVTSLYVYPLKSGRGVSKQATVAQERGFAGDRRLMVVDRTGTFLSQRTHPRLGYVRLNYGAQGAVTLRTPDGSSVTAGRPLGLAIDVTVWGDPVRAIDRGPDAARWLTELLGTDARLVEMPDTFRRPVDGSDVAVSFADGYPYLLTTTASLDDLNHRLRGAPVPMEAFRPNIVLSGSQPWAEDEWRRLRIGAAEFEVMTPCTRCKIPTLDPSEPTCARDDGEPLRTLATFRRGDDGVLFGMNLICRTPDVTLRVGDDVELLDG